MSEDPKTPPQGHFEADISDDAVRAALESVQRREDPVEADGGAAGDGPDAAAPVEVEVAPGESRTAESLQAELRETQAALELSAERARETLERLKDSHDRHLRALADLENYKKRAVREREEASLAAVGKLVKELLPALDNLDRAIEHAGPGESALAQGIAATRKLFLDILGKFGVEAFSALGQPFDPTRHEAVQQVATDAVPPGTVAQEVVRGYLHNGRLLRPALVAVAVQKPVEAAGAAPAAPPGDAS